MSRKFTQSDQQVSAVAVPGGLDLEVKTGGSNRPITIEIDEEIGIRLCEMIMLRIGVRSISIKKSEGKFTTGIKFTDEFPETIPL